jgi:hypothetical protein
MKASGEVPIPKNLQEWVKELNTLVEKMPVHEFAREAIRNQLVLTVLREWEIFQQMPPEMLDELLRLNPHFVRPPKS